MGANQQTSVPAFVAGQVLTAEQQTQINTGIPVFANSTARDAAFGGSGEKTLAEGQFAYLEDTNATQYYNGSAWVAVGQTISAATVTTSQSTTSTSYTDLTTSGPTVTVTTGTSVLVEIQTLGAGAVTNRQYMSFAISGATTVSAGTYEIGPDITMDGARSMLFVVSGLTAGSNTFTCKYKSLDGNSIAFAQRVITVTTL
jgi:hypothetical protein